MVLVLVVIYLFLLFKYSGLKIQIQSSMIILIWMHFRLCLGLVLSGLVQSCLLEPFLCLLILNRSRILKVRRRGFAELNALRRHLVLNILFKSQQLARIFNLIIYDCFIFFRFGLTFFGILQIYDEFAFFRFRLFFIGMHWHDNSLRGLIIVRILGKSLRIIYSSWRLLSGRCSFTRVGHRLLAFILHVFWRQRLLLIQWQADLFGFWFVSFIIFILIVSIIVNFLLRSPLVLRNFNLVLFIHFWFSIAVSHFVKCNVWVSHISTLLFIIITLYFVFALVHLALDSLFLSFICAPTPSLNLYLCHPWFEAHYYHRHCWCCRLCCCLCSCCYFCWR